MHVIISLHISILCGLVIVLIVSVSSIKSRATTIAIATDVDELIGPQKRICALSAWNKSVEHYFHIQHIRDTHCFTFFFFLLLLLLYNVHGMQTNLLYGNHSELENNSFFFLYSLDTINSFTQTRGPHNVVTLVVCEF